MATTFNEMMEVKAFLRQQHIIVSEEWTEACISFLKQEQQPLPFQNLKKKVHQQWLIADLEEIACPSLPQELPTAQKMILNGQFALQLQGIRDISRPAYAQLKELTNTVNTNVEFTSAPKAAIPEWEAKPTRMLMLALTDGCIQVQGMEYRSISFLSPNFSPGIKVLIKGPIECRFGVLLLTSENISILGGAVESKMIEFSRENLLKKQLRIEEEEDNDQSEVIDISSNNTQESSNNIRNSSSRVETNLIQQNQIHSRISSMNSNSSTSLSNLENNAEDVLDHFDSDDDFEQNIDYGMLDEIENSQRQGTSSHEIDDEHYQDVWQEDEDIVRDLMEFQDADPEFKMPFDVRDHGPSTDRRNQISSANEVFTYLSTVANDPTSNCVITIKGFIITVLSKLDCDLNKGWSLTVKINDGTATVNADLHDKVLENIMGVSAQAMIKKKIEAAKNREIGEEVKQIVNKCKLAIQNYSCLMDVKFTPGEKPCIMKCSPVSKLHIRQLLERVSSHF